MARLAIVAENDGIWALTAWERALPLLALDGHVVAGIWAVEARLSRYRGVQIPLWYWKRLGLANFGKLGAFAILHRFARWWLRRPMNLQAMAGAYGLPYFETATPNDAAFVSWLRAERVDVLLITVGHILYAEALAAAKLGVINKHAGVLPGNKGLWPYFWAVVKDLPQGVTYHLVTSQVDGGGILAQHTQVPPKALRSMVAYYAYVYGLFGQHMREAVAQLLAQCAVPQMEVADNSYHSLPDAEDFAIFRRKGGKIMQMADLRLAVTMLDEA